MGVVLVLQYCSVDDKCWVKVLYLTKVIHRCKSKVGVNPKRSQSKTFSHYVCNCLLHCTQPSVYRGGEAAFYCP